MRNRQSGITFIGWLVLLLPLVVVAYAAIRLAPKYLVYTEVSRSLKQLADEYQDNPQATISELKVSLAKHFDIEGIDYPTPEDVQFSKEDGKWVAEIDYQDTAPLFLGVGLTINFAKRVPFK